MSEHLIVYVPTREIIEAYKEDLITKQEASEAIRALIASQKGASK